MYSYGQFCRTPIGRMRVRKTKVFVSGCNECKLTLCSGSILHFCAQNLPVDAYLEKPNVGGKDQHK